MASSTLKLFLLLFPIFLSQTLASPTTTLHPNLTSIRSFCRTRPYPQACFDSLKLGISINISPNILTYLLQSLQTAISEATHLSDLFHNAGGGSSNLVEKQRGSIQDCRELHLASTVTVRQFFKTSSRSREVQFNLYQTSITIVALCAFFLLLAIDRCFFMPGSSSGLSRSGGRE